MCNKLDPESFTIKITGHVQGVGLRPFVYNLCENMEIFGEVYNDSSGVLIKMNTPLEKLNHFLRRLKQERPQESNIEQIKVKKGELPIFEKFEIVESQKGPITTSPILPDLATCSQCLEDIFDPKNRRYKYPFTNCTQCGPRYSIINALPYDRPNTSMANFKMCTLCQKEYDDPKNRRFHAQPNACSQCGPKLTYFSRGFTDEKKPLEKISHDLLEHAIVGLKGIGGFHLSCRADSKVALTLLRKRKKRPTKPFALMVKDIETARKLVHLSPGQEKLLCSSRAPIVLALKKEKISVEDLVAPHNPYLALMLPHSPLHHILLRKIDIPLVMTSANITQESIVTQNDEALKRLEGIADSFLLHNRKIERALEDSVVIIENDSPLFLRLGRGHSPLSLTINKKETILALGGHLKSNFSFQKEEKVFIGPYLGDLSFRKNKEHYKEELKKIISLYQLDPSLVFHDQHPEYATSEMAKTFSVKTKSIQHHLAHFLALISEHHLITPTLGVVWDGVGLGSNQELWGGEFFLLDSNKHIKRVATIHPFMLPGGEVCATESSRIARSLLFEINQLSDLPSSPLNKVIEKKVNSPYTSSIGRLFDGISSLLNICHHSSFEGEAAIQLQYEAEKEFDAPLYSYDFYQKDGLTVFDWRPMLVAITNDISKKKSASLIALSFHKTLAVVMIKLAKESDIEQIAVSGGCFQNTLLLKEIRKCLEKENLKLFRHKDLPSNDSNLSFGQLMSGQYTWDKELCV
jgi:hydrogenase maturation protein HypF